MQARAASYAQIDLSERCERPRDSRNFNHRADRLLSKSERRDVIDYSATRPKAGELMRRTGGLRNLRWAYGSRGKSGGARVVYCFHSDRMPLYLLTLFGENEQANLSAAERSDLNSEAEKPATILMSEVARGIVIASEACGSSQRRRAETGLVDHNNVAIETSGWYLQSVI